MVLLDLVYPASCIISANSIGFENQNPSASTNVRILGKYASYTALACPINGNLVNTCYDLSDGCKFKLMGSSITTSNIGILVENIGDGPNIQIAGVVVYASATYDLNIEHPSVTGVVNAVLTQSKVSVTSSANISLSYQDPKDSGLNIVGMLSVGPSNSQLCNVQPMLYQSTSLGLISGGTISNVTGLTINVLAGTGYCTDPSDNLIYLSW